MGGICQKIITYKSGQLVYSLDIQRLIIFMQKEEANRGHNFGETHGMDTECLLKVEETNLSDSASKQQHISSSASQRSEITTKMMNQYHNQCQFSNNSCKNSRIPQQKKESLTNNAYYTNYAYLHEWLRQECVKGKLTRQAYANTVCLMDIYYRNNPLVKEKFLPIALSLIIISSKALQRKVLYTSRVAKLNNIDFEIFLEIQKELLVYFGFRISSYNFVRVMNTFLKRWDDEVAKMRQWQDVVFFRDNEDNYMLYESVYFLCDSFLKHKKSLTQNNVKEITKYVLFEKCNSQTAFQVDSVIESIFAQRIFTVEQQHFYSFEKNDLNDPFELRILLKTWQQQFLLMDGILRNRYRTHRSSYSTYSEFIYLLP